MGVVIDVGVGQVEEVACFQVLLFVSPEVVFPQPVGELHPCGCVFGKGAGEGVTETIEAAVFTSEGYRYFCTWHIFVPSIWLI